MKRDVDIKADVAAVEAGFAKLARAVVLLSHAGSQRLGLDVLREVFPELVADFGDVREHLEQALEEASVTIEIKAAKERRASLDASGGAS